MGVCARCGHWSADPDPVDFDHGPSNPMYRVEVWADALSSQDRRAFEDGQIMLDALADQVWEGDPCD